MNYRLLDRRDLEAFDPAVDRLRRKPDNSPGATP